ncbi:MAG: hypothetical protein UH853_02065 [Muribaculaceae bacterium]|nr:hypothetical protein [Muribaculaceae bacterium]
MTKLILTITTLLCTVISGNVKPENPEIPDVAQPVPIRKETPEINRPRTPDYCSEISAYYQNGVIYLQFSEDIGCMDVQVINLSTGELWSDDASGTAVVNRTYTLNGTPFTSHKLTIVK